MIFKYIMSDLCVFLELSIKLFNDLCGILWKLIQAASALCFKGKQKCKTNRVRKQQNHHVLVIKGLSIKCRTRQDVAFRWKAGCGLFLK